jgi:V/A-type H+-transporting ATPase subunit D
VERLHAAERAADLLDRKLRVLRAEQRRRHEAAEGTDAEWRARWRDAETWLLRAAVLGGQRAIRLAEPARPVDVEIGWTVVMGVSYPVDAVVHWDPPTQDAVAPGNTALARAVTAYQQALEAAARHAVARAAVQRIDAEVATTRRRLRAVRSRWIPRLTASLHDTEIALEEMEHADGIRLRWAAGRQGADEETPTGIDSK